MNFRETVLPIFVGLLLVLFAGPEGSVAQHWGPTPNDSKGRSPCQLRVRLNVQLCEMGVTRGVYFTLVDSFPPHISGTAHGLSRCGPPPAHC
jgi:hypothetical protein